VPEEQSPKLYHLKGRWCLNRSAVASRPHSRALHQAPIA
jgi:hypothetical protein